MKDINNITKCNFYYPFIIFLMGPTASGKTRLAIDLCKRKLIKIKIISVDSGLIYKGMNIGTAKPSSLELENIPYNLIDIRDPSESYSVADFYYDAILEIKNIIQSGYIPLLVGGTMLYFKVLLEGLFSLPKTNQKIRNNLEYEAQKIGWTNMYNKLKCIDPIASNQIHWNDHKRIIRALEIFLISGQTKTSLKMCVNNNIKRLRYQVLQFALMPSNRISLYNRIETRFYHMLKTGFEDEVNILFNRSDLHIGPKPSITCVGYRQMWEYLSKNITYDEMIRKGIYATKRLAKQQLTWLRRWPNLIWLNSDDDISVSEKKMLQILSQYLPCHFF